MTETKMEVIKLMPKEYTEAEANAFKHGFFLGAKSEREEMMEKMQDWIADTFQYDGSNDFNGGSNDAMSMLLDDFTEYIKQAMKGEEV